MRTLYYGQPVSRQAPLNRGLVGWWLGTPLRSGGLTLFDLMGKNHGTLIGGPTWSPGKVGKALRFDGLDDFVSKSNPSFLTNSQGTVAAWVKLNNLTSGQIAVAISTDGGLTDEYYMFYFRGDALKQIQVANLVVGGVDQAAFKTPNNAITDTNWHHLAVSSDGSTVRAYIDGVAQTLTATLGSNTGQWFSAATNADIFTIGDLKRASAVAPWNGLIDDVRIYNRALSADEVRALYRASSTGYQRELNRLVDDNAYAIAGGAQFKAVADTAALSESLAKMVMRAIAETPGFTEELKKQTQRRIEESAVLTEDLKKEARKTIAETATLDEAFAKLAGKTIGETAVLTEDQAVQIGRAIAESAALAEELKKQIQRQIAESVGLSENLTAAVVKLKDIAETVALAEALSRLTGKAVGEALGLSEAETRQIGKSAAEAIVLTENLSKQVERAIGDALGLTESLDVQAGKVLTETVNLSEDLKKQISRTVAETLGLSESFQARVTRVLGLQETVSLSEALAAEIVIIGAPVPVDIVELGDLFDLAEMPDMFELVEMA